MIGRKLQSLCLIATCLFATISTTGYCVDETDHKINYGDTLSVKIPAEPEMGGTFSIQSQGTLDLIPVGGIDLGQFEVVGLTTSQLEAEISRRLSEYFVNSDAFVTLTTSATYVSIFGKVLAQGKMQYRDNLKLLDLIIHAQGFSPEADMTSISIYREIETTPINMDVTDLVTGVSSENNILLLPGDYVIAPPLRSDTKIKIITLGQVKTTGSVTVPKGSKLIDVFAEAGGSFGRSALGKSYVIRMVNDQPQVIHCDLKKLIMRADMSQNIEMKDGDIFFVPESDGIDVMQVVRDVLDINLLKNTIQDDF